MTNVAAETAATFCATLADEWQRSGVREAVICPGSRSTPLALALVRQAGIRVSVRLDERAAGFFGVGLALASGRPVVLLTTSGTAAAELHAAVVEAHHAGVPLIVCTADRPPELHDVGAPQAIDQLHLYGRAVRWFAAPGVPDEAGRTTWRSLASRAVAEAQHGPLGPGPVHLNLAFREPLNGEAGPLPPPRASGGTWHAVHRRPDADSADLRDVLRPSARGVIVAGYSSRSSDHVAALAAALGWPVLADPRSGCRIAGPYVVGAADALLRHEGFAAEMLPDVVLRCGDPWASKVLGAWLSRSAGEGAVHVALDPDWAWKDAGRDVAVRVTGGSAASGTAPRDAGGWAKRWAEAEAVAQEAIDGVLEARAAASEPSIARALFAAVPGDATIVASSSMPVRDLEWFGRPRPKPPRVLANRGANGIDGVVSTTLGVAAALAADRGEVGVAARAGGAVAEAGGVCRVFGLVGDLAVLHDASALVRPVSGAPLMPAVIVVLDNAGGGIFNFLPQATDLDEAEFEQLFGTPQLPHVTDLVRGCGLFVAEVTESARFLPVLGAAGDEASSTGGPAFVVVHTDRKENVALHAEIERAVGRALSALPAAESW
jgi:2-succinyl-5-enolpyruvyl-6-hydroxy-3-cyclohexene-1-carboxylate synthase